MLYVGVDTALVNAGLVVLNDEGEVKMAKKPYPKKTWKGDEDSFFAEHRRIRQTASWIFQQVETVFGRKDIFYAFEDYLLTGFQRSYKTAELLSLLKDGCNNAMNPYCIVHPLKTKKYVVKRREVSKTDMINYAKQHSQNLFTDIDAADYSDIADAYAIAQIGRLAYMVHNKMPLPRMEDRWFEILNTPTNTGILQKPGLYWQPEL